MTTDTTLEMPNDPELSEWHVTANGQLIQIAISEITTSEN